MNWNRIETLFLELLELTPEEREQRLATEPDAGLREEVGAMLDAHHGDELSIETRLLAPVETPDLSGERIGNYRLLELVGQGGMGEVYRARRDDDLYEREVAVKLVQYGPRRSLHERFARERAILARLTHPNVATLYDGGVHEDGRPYLVMEYVEGLPITDYCDRNGLSIRARIDLFIQVCETVQHAHGALIVHRDLKASNILVNTEGQPKLLDFGIARLLEEEDDDNTRGLDRVLTPEHAAPEQIRGEEPTIATDVYGLGVLLCELLSGHRPIEFPTRSPIEIDRIAREVDPALPSRLLDESAALHRRTTRQRLRGDLDAICAKALRKEPEERYLSAAELIADLRRHLHARPVRAVQGSKGYFARKFLRRHRASLALSATAFLVLAGFLGLTLVQRDEIRTQRDRARQEAARSELVLDRMVDLFEEAQPRAAGEPDAMDIDEFLRRGEETASFLEDDPAARARMVRLLAGIYTNRGDLERAIDLTDQALELTSNARDRVRLQHEIAVLRNRHEGPPVGIPLLRASLARHEELLGENHPDTGRARIALAIALDDRREARALVEPTLAAPTTTGLARAAALNALAQIEIYESNLGAARRHLEEARAIFEASLPRTAHQRRATEHNLAAVYARLGMWDQAERTQRELLAMVRDLYGPDSDLVANSLEGLAVTLANQGRHDEAAAHFAEALAIFERTLAAGHWRIANGERNVGQLLSLDQRYAEALPHFDRSIELFGLERAIHVRGQRAVAWIGLGRIEDALTELEVVLARMDEPARAASAAYRSDARIWLGLALAWSDRDDEARQRFTEARRLRAEIYPAGHPKIAEARCGQAATGSDPDPGAAGIYLEWGLAHPLLLALLDR